VRSSVRKVAPAYDWRVYPTNGESHIPVLKSFSFTALPKSANHLVQIRRAKFVAGLEEQKLPQKAHPPSLAGE
jgi:hypothetical protein